MQKFTQEQKELIVQANLLAKKANGGCEKSKLELLHLLAANPKLKKILLTKAESAKHRRSSKGRWRSIGYSSVMSGLIGRTSARTWRTTK
ncbi:hypothetical protein ACFOEE_18345 [Pseudoalteromonas fenneropenaei]|uniref:Uncharacterized protein n=1 Tax=Pseudoalteromonas fenneropenaei TaxID=1737459 RepID=A0ABV7CPM1_9GAMM